MAGFCACFFDLIEDVRTAPPQGWENWTFAQWDDWFGRINGTYLVDLERFRVIQYPMYQTHGRLVKCDLSDMPGRLSLVHSRVA